ncbi:hypothetical protein [Streptomyces sp. NPDC002491]
MGSPCSRANAEGGRRPGPDRLTSAVILAQVAASGGAARQPDDAPAREPDETPAGDVLLASEAELIRSLTV